MYIIDYYSKFVYVEYQFRREYLNDINIDTYILKSGNRTLFRKKKQNYNNIYIVLEGKNVYLKVKKIIIYKYVIIKTNIN